MERHLEIHLSWQGATSLIGSLWARIRGTRESCSFEYARGWLDAPHAFALDPELPLSRGQFHTDRPLFNALTDPAPDRWGQTLLRRSERSRARAEGRAPRTLFSIDFLTLVTDETRLGSLRFRDVGGEQFLNATGGVPPIVQLPRLLSATQALLADEESDDDLSLLLAPGTSLGGARPKASVRDQSGRLAIAKFPGRDEDWPVVRWEAATLSLAEVAGIVVPDRRLETVARKAILVLQRFDRDGDTRIPYISAMTAIGANDTDDQVHGYQEIADALRIDAAAPREDLAQLWRRIVFNVLVSNTDDHARNHGFLRTAAGWRLCPAFDLNPMPSDVRPRIHALAIYDDDATSSLELAQSAAGSFGLRPNEGRAIIKEVSKAVRKWRDVARKHGITNAQIDRMASAFEHADAVLAQKL